MDDFPLEQEVPEPELEKEWDEWDDDSDEDENSGLDEAFSSWDDFNNYMYR